MKRLLIPTFLLVCFLLSACGPKGPATLTVMTHDSFAVSADVVTAFEQTNNVKVTFIKSGDAGAALNKAILSKDAPLADIFYGVDNTFLSRALEAGIYEPYASPLLANIPAEFKLDPQNRALPVDYGDVCINYDKAYFTDHSLAVPQSLEELTRPEYKGLLVVENPATSSPGLAFLLATVKHFGADGYLDYWRALRANGVVIVDGWETAYWLEDSLLHQFQRLVGTRAAADGHLVCLQPGRGGCLCRNAADRIPHRIHSRTRYLLPSNRIRRHPERDQEPRPGRKVRGFHAGRDVPGGYAPANVYVPRQPRSQATRGFYPIRPGSRAASRTLP